MYTIIGSPKNRAARVIWMLEELGEKYEFVAAMPHTPEVLAHNVGGKVPVLIDGDFALSDSAAILMYLADKHGKLTYPVGSQERAKLTSIMFFAQDEVECPPWTLAKHSFLPPKDLHALDAIKPMLEHDFAKAMRGLAARLGDGPYIMGEDFTIADIYLGHTGSWARGAGFEIPEGPVADYFARVSQRPGWQVVKKAREAA
ncbi:MAG: glutathione S-transferase family protein [Pikeienuella sp.]